MWGAQKQACSMVYTICVVGLRQVDISHPTGHYTYKQISARAPLEKILGAPQADRRLFQNGSQNAVLKHLTWESSGVTFHQSGLIRLRAAETIFTSPAQTDEHCYLTGVVPSIGGSSRRFLFFSFFSFGGGGGTWRRDKSQDTPKLKTARI